MFHFLRHPVYNDDGVLLLVLSTQISTLPLDRRRTPLTQHYTRDRCSTVADSKLWSGSGSLLHCDPSLIPAALQSVMCPFPIIPFADTTTSIAAAAAAAAAEILATLFGITVTTRGAYVLSSVAKIQPSSS